jgi:myo-inositol-1-phosphate synthase
MMNQSRLASKKTSKENVIRAQNDIRGIPVEDESLFAGPSTWLPYLKDNKVAYFRLEMESFGGAPIEFDAKLKVCDSENSAGVVVDAIRYLQVAREEGIIGSLRGPSAYTQKTPPQQLPYDVSRRECEAFVARNLEGMTTRNTFSNEKA